MHDADDVVEPEEGPLPDPESEVVVHHRGTYLLAERGYLGGGDAILAEALRPAGATLVVEFGVEVGVE